MAQQLDLPVGTPPSRARALQALAKKGRLHSEKVRVADTGQQVVKLRRDKLDDRVEVPSADGETRLVWPEDEERYRRTAEIEEAFAAFCEDQEGVHPSELRLAAVHADDDELYDPEDAATHARLLQDFRIAYPQYDPSAEEAEA